MSVIEFHEAREEDIPDLYALSVKFQERYLIDGESLVREKFSIQALEEDYTLVFTAPTLEGKTPIGSVSFSDINQDLSAVVHFILRPAYFKAFLREKVYLDALIDRFRAVKVKSFLCYAFGFNRVAQKLAKEMGFRHVGTLAKQVYFQGQVYDNLLYQLERADLSRALREQFLKEEEVQGTCHDFVIPPESNVAKLPKRPRKSRK